MSYDTDNNDNEDNENNDIDVSNAMDTHTTVGNARCLALTVYVTSAC